METIVYILFSLKDDNRFEFGLTNDLEKRILAHNKGLSPVTRNFRPWKLFATKVVESRAAATKMVKELRRLRSKEGLVVFMLQNKFEVSKE